MAIDQHDYQTGELLPETHKTVIQDNELVTARYVNALRLQDRRLMYLAWSKLDQTKAHYTDEDRWIRIYAKEFAEIFNITHHDFYDGLSEACQRLWHTDVCVSELGPNKKFVHVFEAIGYIKTEGFVELKFTPSIMLYLTTISQQYTICQLRQLAKLKSTHAMSLYTLLRRHNKYGWYKVSPQELRRILSIDDTEYTRFYDLKTKVIDPALRQINKHTDLNVTYEKPTKNGRNIEMLHFTFTPKSH